ncbi:MAG: putative site-specific recombinase [Cereibacter sp.]|jgi:DNA invertase Pin-like site-specific DNA recombinase|nr:putative site-specific recombinase [Cereibacter sp.]
MKPNAYSYVRFSSAAQASGDSLRRQVQASVDYARTHDLNLVEDFELSDLGVSAYHGLNATEGALAKFLNAVERGDIPRGSYLLVESLDRMSRENVLMAFPRFSAILNAGIKIVTLSNGQIYGSEDGQGYNFIIAVSDMLRANAESEHKSVRIAASWQNRRDTAALKKMTSIAPLWLSLNEGKSTFSVDEEKANVVRLIFQSAADGKGSNIITKELNRSGVKPFGKSKVWVESYVTKILKNRAVLGEFQPHRKIDGKRVPVGDVLENYYPAVISEDQFNLVKAARRNRAINGGGARGENQSSLFSHVGYCGYCGSKMRHFNKGYGPKGGQYLVCLNSKNGSGCVSKGWRYHDFERTFLSFVKDVDLRSLVGGAAKTSEIANLRDRLVSSREKVANKEWLINDYLLKIEATPELDKSYTSRMLTLSSEVKIIEGEVDEMESAVRALEQNSNSAISDAELIELIEVFKGNTKGERFKLSDRITQIVKRIDIFVSGNARVDKTIAFIEASDEDIDFKQKMIEHLRRDGGTDWSSRPHFIVHFENGSVQIVIPDPANPENLVVNGKAGKDEWSFETDVLERHSRAEAGCCEDLVDITDFCPVIASQ